MKDTSKGYSMITMLTRSLALMALFIFYCEPLQAQWVQVGPVEGIYGLDTDPEGLYLYAHTGSGIIRSSDLGLNWTYLSLGPADLVFYDHGEIIAGTPEGQIFHSSNYGDSWDSISISMRRTGVSAMCRADSELFAGTQGYGIFRSLDTGRSWMAINVGLDMQDSMIYWTVSALTANNGYIFAGTYYGYGDAVGVIRSKLDTFVWVNIDPDFSGGNITAFSTIGPILFVAGNNFDAGEGAIHRSTDSGKSWSNIGPSVPNQEAISLCYSFPYLISSQHGSGVFFSTDSGTSWVQSTNGLPISTIINYKYEDFDGLAVERGYVFAGVSGDSSGLWRRPLSDLAPQDSIVLIAPPDDSAILNFSQSYSMMFLWHTLPAARSYVFSIRSGLWDSTITTEDTSIVVPLSRAAGGYFSWSVYAQFDSGISLTSERTLIDIDTPVRTVTPPNGISNITMPVNFTWIAPVDQYGFSWRKIIVATDRELTQIAAQDSQIEIPTTTISYLKPNTTYYWAVGVNGMMWGLADSLWIWSDTAMFTTGGDADVKEADASPPSDAIHSYPNPFSQSTEITFSSEATGYADVSILNLLGAEVAHLFSGEVSAGEHSFLWSKPTGLPDGMYECLVRMNGRVETLPMVLAR